MTAVDQRINDGGAACGGSPVMRITTTIGSNLNTLSVRVLIRLYRTRFPVMRSQVDSHVRFGVRHVTSDRFDQTAQIALGLVQSLGEPDACRTHRNGRISGRIHIEAVVHHFPSGSENLVETTDLDEPYWCCLVGGDGEAELMKQRSGELDPAQELLFQSSVCGREVEVG